MIGLDISQASSIRATAQEWGAPTVTAVHILNLQAHRERLGASWPACRRYLDTWVTSKAPNPELAMLIPTDNGYALVFRNAQEQAAFAMTRVLADAIDTVADAIPELSLPPLRCQIQLLSIANLPSRDLSNNAHENVREESAKSSPSSKKLEVDLPGAIGDPLRFHPVLHHARNQIVGSLSVSPTDGKGGHSNDAKYFFPSQLKADLEIANFLKLLGKAFSLHKKGLHPAIFFPVNFNSFCSPDLTRQYIQSLRQVPPFLAKSLTPRLIRIHPGTSKNLLVEKVRSLGAIFKHVAVHSRPSIPRATFEFVNATIITTSWREVLGECGLDNASEEGRTKIEGCLRNFVIHAQTLRAHSLICNVDEALALDIAKAARVDMISGSSVGGCSLSLDPTECTA